MQLKRKLNARLTNLPSIRQKKKPRLLNLLNKKKSDYSGNMKKRRKDSRLRLKRRNARKKKQRL